MTYRSPDNVDWEDIGYDVHTVVDHPNQRKYLPEALEAACSFCGQAVPDASPDAEPSDVVCHACFRGKLLEYLNIITHALER